MSLTSAASDNRFWRDGRLRVLRRIAEGWKVPDHVFGGSTASTNRFEALQEHLQLLTILVENRRELENSPALQDLGEKDLRDLDENFMDLDYETREWVRMLTDLSNETRSLRDDIERLVRGNSPE